MAVACPSPDPRHRPFERRRPLPPAEKILEARPDASQRQLAEALGVSLGKTNYCVRALLEKGWVKAQNFKNSQNNLAYAYLLKPSGADAKARITARFLKRQIEQLTTEVNMASAETSKRASKKPVADGGQAGGDA